MTLSKLSVCVCTYNRAKSLAHTLFSLTQLKDIKSLDWDLLVIDNNSNDQTKSVIKKYENHLPLRYIRETKQGLSHARNRALTECDSEVLIFTDDDVKVDVNWLSSYAEAVSSFPDADYFGGRILPHWSTEKPKWMRDETMPLIGGLLVICDNGPEVRYYRDTDSGPFGASFGVRRRMIKRLSPFRVDLGPKLHVPGRGDDDEYLLRAKQAGYRGIYCGRAVCYHQTDPKRLRIGYMYRFGVQKGIAEKRMSTDNNSRGSITLELNYAIRGLFQLCTGRGDRFRQCIINMGIQRGMRQES
jgi:glycosyltransferase involved in cell wall biosynthesis